jgi:hypothetical protein
MELVLTGSSDGGGVLMHFPEPVTSPGRDHDDDADEHDTPSPAWLSWMVNDHYHHHHHRPDPNPVMQRP